MPFEEEIWIRGAPVSEGIAIGIPFLLSTAKDEPVIEFSISDRDVEGEIARYRDAIFFSRQDLQRLHSYLMKEGPDDVASIIETHIQMLDDPLMTIHIEERIRDTRKNTEAVFNSAMKEYERRFSEAKDHVFQQRMVDVKDLSKRILGHLFRKQEAPFDDVPQNAIVFAKELIPSHTAAVSTARVSAFVTQIGGGNSHAALIARAKGIPYVAGVDFRGLEKVKIKMAIVDGMTGDVVLNPSSKTLDSYRDTKHRVSMKYSQLEKEGTLPSETIDGYHIRVMANVGTLDDLDQIHTRGAGGIGLFRSEYLFLTDAKLFPSEEEQYNAYVQLVKKMKGLPVVIRVFDIGGDKNPELFADQRREPNPVLGCRGIRFLLRHPEIFKTQLRAIARASLFGDVHILLPLISDLGELLEAKALLKEVKAELKQHNFIPLGCMIEVPSAAFICDAIAKECEFLSVGTNDLVQYTLGVDRSNHSMGEPYYPAHPSIIRMIKMLAIIAARHQIHIGICGEIASNPLFIPLFIGLGIQEFSCASRYIPIIKNAIRRASLIESYQIAEKVLQLNTAQEISQVLAQVKEKIGAE